MLNERGLDPEAVERHRRTTGSVTGLPGADTISNAELLALDVEVLIPAALQGVLNESNVDEVRARVRRLEAEACRQLARTAMRLDSVEAVWDLVRDRAGTDLG